jgi:hypothetical protein
VKRSIFTTFGATKAKKHLKMPRSAILGCLKGVCVFVLHIFWFFLSNLVLTKG